MQATIAVLPGDGIGPEVTAAARSVLEGVARLFDHDLTFREGSVGGAALDATGDPLPEATRDLCADSDAILLGAVGGPQWADPNAAVRPEQGLLDLRRRFELFANLRPVSCLPGLEAASPLKPERVRDVDLLIVRELTGGLYFGPREEKGEGQQAFDTMLYDVSEVERIAHLAFQAARRRRNKVTSVDKANVLASMRLWRSTVDDVAGAYPDVEVEHLLVDACAMRLITSPADFDVLLAGNLFGDILSDEAAVIGGSLGLLPSASLGADDGGGRRFGLYEPVHGSAPDLAGQGVANPVGAILSAALLLRYSLGLEEEAILVETAVSKTLGDGVLTPDLVQDPTASTGTEGLARAIVDRLEEGCGVWLTV